MTTVTLPGGETIWYKTTGTGAPLLHIHGSAFGHRNFEKMTPLAAQLFEVIDFDLPGYGESIGNLRPGGMEGLAEQVFEFIQAAGYDRVHLHGTSFGAMIGLTLAARHPDVIDHLVLSCFLARSDDAARMMRGTWKRAAKDSGMTAVADLTSVAGFARSFYDRPYAQEQLQTMRDAFSRTDAGAFVAGTETIEKTDLSDLIPLISAPTLLLAGAEDNMTPFEPSPSGIGMQQIANELPLCNTQVIPECGHYLVIEQPELATQYISSFING
ncbi:MAG: alpha/beta fold hydrolase [Alphaproteobacteria bacterium]|nr:alpha/beta fold hydrolase [Alphaproteobacteria bacterium]